MQTVRAAAPVDISTGLLPAQLADLPDVVRTHQACFPEFFLTRLGPWFLREYYRLVLESTGGILWVAKQDNRVVGFIAGFVKPTQFYASMRTKKWRFAVPILVRLLTKPLLLPRVLLNFRQVNQYDAQRTLHPGIAAELSSIGVDPVAAGRGVGKQLVAHFLRVAAQQQADYVTLTTDAHDNTPVNRFYASLGFGLADTMTQADGRVMNVYLLTLSHRERVTV